MMDHLARIPGHTLRRLRRLWLQYGILWLGAVLVGLVAVMYAWLIDLGFDLFRSMQQQHSWLPLLLTPAMSALCVWLTRRFFAGAEGSGIPQVMATLSEHGEDAASRAPMLLSLKVLLGKIGISFLGIVGGFTI